MTTIDGLDNLVYCRRTRIKAPLSLAIYEASGMGFRLNLVLYRDFCTKMGITSRKKAEFAYSKDNIHNWHLVFSNSRGYSLTECNFADLKASLPIPVEFHKKVKIVYLEDKKISINRTDDGTLIVSFSIAGTPLACM